MDMNDQIHDRDILLVVQYGDSQEPSIQGATRQMNVTKNRNTVYSTPPRTKENRIHPYLCG